MDDFWTDAEIIHAYTRKQAIEDGVLVDLMQEDTRELVENAGFRFSIAMTATAFSPAVWPIDNEQAEQWLKARSQDLKGRLWDVLWMMRLAARNANASTLLFEFIVLDWESKRPRRMMLKAIIGPGDQGEPVLTIMLPDEN